jgi:hypothetical protein
MAVQKFLVAFGLMQITNNWEIWSQWGHFQTHLTYVESVRKLFQEEEEQQQ